MSLLTLEDSEFWLCVAPHSVKHPMLVHVYEMENNVACAKSTLCEWMLTHTCYLSDVWAPYITMRWMCMSRSCVLLEYGANVDFNSPMRYNTTPCYRYQLQFVIFAFALAVATRLLLEPIIRLLLLLRLKLYRLNICIAVSSFFLNILQWETKRPYSLFSNWM